MRSQTKPLNPQERERAAAAAPAAESTASLASAIVALALGMVFGIFTAPFWVPLLQSSLSGEEPKFFWYLSRASAFTAFALIWLSMVSGLLISSRIARSWPGPFAAFDLHQFASLLGLGFAAIHVFALLGEKYIGYSLTDLLIPFISDAYRQVWVGIGQISFYVLLPVTFTFYIRKRIGTHLWRAIHLTSYGLFALMLLHGVFSGTDSGNIWVSLIYWFSAISLIGLTIYRITVAQNQNRPTRAQSGYNRVSNTP